MATLTQYVQGARPKTLSAALTPVALGSALAFIQPGENFSVSVSIACLIVALSLQVGVNYANDYSDGIKGTDDNRVGPMRLVGSGVASPRDVLVAMCLSFFVAAIAGLYVASRSSWWLVVLGAACISLAWFYTGGKYAYGYYGFGELVVFICFGLVATVGTYFANTQSISWQAVVASFIPGLFSVGVLLANNIRDIATDRVSGKKTLATRIGERNARNIFLGCCSGVVLAILLLGISMPMVLLALIPCLMCIPLARALTHATVPPHYIAVLVGTSRANVVVSLTAAFLIIVSDI